MTMIDWFGRKQRGLAATAAKTGSDARLSLQTANERIAAARSIEDVVAAIRDTARAVVGSDGITVVRREGDEVVYVTEDAISPLWAGQRFPIETCISGMAIRARAPIVIPDILLDKRVPLNAYLATFVRSMVMVPVGRDDPQMAIGAYWQAAEPIASIAVDRLTAVAAAAADRLALLAGPPEDERQVA